MSTLTQWLRPVAESRVLELPQTVAEASPREATAWRPQSFADEQIALLVRQLFFPGGVKPARHIVISAVDESTYIAEICMDVAKALSARVPGSVCVTEANPRNPQLESVFGNKHERTEVSEGFGFLRSSSQRVGGGLWLAPHELLSGTTAEGNSPAWLERRLSDFRLEFDYTILHAPAAGRFGDAALLGRLSDGIVLVVEANVTRRVTAQKTKEKLQAANARLLGTVLSERTFPIPEEIYRRL
jgi:Mrp family chromosome partitioning ATPase